MINRENFASKEEYIRALSQANAKEVSYITGKKESSSNQFAKPDIRNVAIKTPSEEVVRLKIELKEKDNFIDYQRQRIEMLEKLMKDHGFIL